MGCDNGNNSYSEIIVTEEMKARLALIALRAANAALLRKEEKQEEINRTLRHDFAQIVQHYSQSDDLTVSLNKKNEEDKARTLEEYNKQLDGTNHALNQATTRCDQQKIKLRKRKTVIDGLHKVIDSQRESIKELEAKCEESDEQLNKMVEKVKELEGNVAKCKKEYRALEINYNNSQELCRHSMKNYYKLRGKYTYYKYYKESTRHIINNYDMLLNKSWSSY